jgi:hypothetical protein
MALTEEQLRHWFGTSPFQHQADTSGIGDVLYEGWASQGIPTSESGWYIQKHTYDGSGNYLNTKSVTDAVWDARTLYTYT